MKRIILVFIVLIIICVSCIYANAIDIHQEEIYLGTGVGEGYIVTVAKDTSHLSGNAMLFGDFSESYDISNEQIVEYITENIENTRPLISEIGIIKVEDEHTLNKLIAQGLVESYELNYMVYFSGYDYSDNPDYRWQWGHSAVNSHYAWGAGVFGTDVRVGVIDTGVYPHNDLLHCLEQGYNYSDNTTDTTDTYGHGTFIAGIIAAQCNDISLVGLAHRAKIVPLKIGEGRTSELDNVILAIKDAVDVFECDIINMSFSTPYDTEQLKSAIDYAEEKGAILVAAAGNGYVYSQEDEYGNTADEVDYETYLYPAAYDNVISVSNAQKHATKTYVIADTSTHNDKVDIAAPGTKVFSLSASSDGFEKKNGTSYSAAYVSAAAALVKGVFPDINQTQFISVFKKTANSSYITEAQNSDYWGSGILDVKALMEYILAENFGDFYLSSPDKQIYGNNTSVYVTNLKDTDENFGSLILWNFRNNENGFSVIDDVRIVPIKLAGGESKEVSFTQLGLFGNVNYTMLSDKLKPLINPMRYVTVEKQ